PNGRPPGRIDSCLERSGLMSDFAGREDHQRSAVSQPQACRPKSCLAARARGRSGKRIDEEAEVRQFRNPTEEIACQNSSIHAMAAENRSDHKALQHTVGMIRRDTQWACGPNVSLILFRASSSNFTCAQTPALDRPSPFALCQLVDRAVGPEL